METREIKATAKLKKNMHGELERLEEKAFKAGYEQGKKDGTTLTGAEQSCSWQKGVMDAWEYLKQAYKETSKDSETYLEEHLMMYRVFNDLDPISYVREFVEVKNREKHEKTTIKVGDVVLDPSNHECRVTNTDTHIHVIYPNGKTHKWLKSTEFWKVIGEGDLKTAEGAF